MHTTYAHTIGCIIEQAWLQMNNLKSKKQLNFKINKIGLMARMQAELIKSNQT